MENNSFDRMLSRPGSLHFKHKKSNTQHKRNVAGLPITTAASSSSSSLPLVMRQRDMNKIEIFDENNSYLLGDRTSDFSDENGDSTILSSIKGNLVQHDGAREGNNDDKVDDREDDEDDRSILKANEIMIIPSESLNTMSRQLTSTSDSSSNTSIESSDVETIDEMNSRSNKKPSSRELSFNDNYFHDRLNEIVQNNNNDQFKINICSANSQSRSLITPIVLCSSDQLSQSMNNSIINEQQLGKNYVKVYYQSQGEKLAEYDKNFTLEKLLNFISPQPIVNKYPPFYDLIEHNKFSRTDESILLSILDDEIDESNNENLNKKKSLRNLFSKFCSSFKTMKLEDYYKKYPWERYFDQEIIENNYDQGTGEFNFDMLPSNIYERNYNYFKRSESTYQKQHIPFVISAER